MKTITNVSEVYLSSGGDPIARSNPVVTSVSAPVITPYVRSDNCVSACCCGDGCGSACACALLACLCAGLCGRNSCNRNCCNGRCFPCHGCNTCPVVTAFYGRGCGCRGYSCYYPYYC